MPALCVCERCRGSHVWVIFGSVSSIYMDKFNSQLQSLQSCKHKKKPRRHVRNNTLAVSFACHQKNSHLGRHFSCKRVSLAEGAKTTCDVIGTFCSTRLTLWFKNRTVCKRKGNFSAGCQVQEMWSFNLGPKLSLIF